VWQIVESKDVQKALARVPRAIAVKYNAWRQIASIQGPQGLRSIPGFHDEALQGHPGIRSSRLNRQYRVIYQLVQTVFQVMHIDPHTYRL
jgi:toxin HigB-1